MRGQTVPAGGGEALTASIPTETSNGGEQEGARQAAGSAHSTGQSEKGATLTVTCTLPPFSSLPRRPRLDLLGQQLIRQVLSVA